MRGVRRAAYIVTATFIAVAGVLLEATEVRAEPLEVRVVTFNAWDLPFGVSRANGPRIERIGPAIAALRPDVVCFQELWIDADAEKVQAALAAAGLVHWRRFPSGLIGSGLHVSTRFPIEDASFLRYACGGHPWKLWHGDFHGGKGIARLRVRTPIGPLDVADTHLHAVYGDEAEYLATRAAEALEAAEFLVEKDGVPLVLAGDLNSWKGSLPFELLAHGAGLAALPAEDRIDWVIARSGATVSARIASYERALSGPVALSNGESRPLSDHEARLAVVFLEPSARAKLAARGPHPRAAEARAVLEAAIAASATRTLVLVGAALGLSALAGALVRRNRPTRRWLRRAVAGAALAVTILLLAVAFLFEPRERSGLREALRRLEPSPL